MKFKNVILSKITLAISGTLIFTLASCKSTDSTETATVKDSYIEPSKLPKDARKIAQCADTKGWSNGHLTASLTLYDYDSVTFGQHHHFLFAFGKLDGRAFSFYGPISDGAASNGVTAITFTPSHTFTFQGEKGTQIDKLNFYFKASQTESGIRIPANSIEFTFYPYVPGQLNYNPLYGPFVQLTCNIMPSIEAIKSLVRPEKYSE